MKALLTSGAALAAIIAVAGCGGSSGQTNAGSGAAATTGSSATVSTRVVHGAGTVLVDSAGSALYAPDQEKSGKILCTGSCTSIWKPLTIASGTPRGPGKLGVVKRPDGRLQVTAGGRPLYTFVQDQPGKVTGNGADDSFGRHSFTWHVITAKGMPSSGGSTGGGSSSRGGYGYGSGY